MAVKANNISQNDVEPITMSINFRINGREPAMQIRQNTIKITALTIIIGAYLRTLQQNEDRLIRTAVAIKIATPNAKA